MTLEQLIRYSIDGILSGEREPESARCYVQELVDILIDFPDDTDKDLRSILTRK